MTFQPITDWRNWHTSTRQGRLQSGAVVTVSQDVTENRVHLALVRTLPLPLDVQLTPNEAFALGTELMHAAVQMQADALVAPGVRP